MMAMRGVTVFSITAPFVTEEDEQKDKEALTPAELQEIHDDLYGYENDTSFNPILSLNIVENEERADEDIDDYDDENDCYDVSCTINGDADDDAGSLHRTTNRTADDDKERGGGSLRSRRNSRSLQSDSSHELEVGHEMIRDALNQMPIDINAAYRNAIEKNPALAKTDDCQWDFYLIKYHNDVWAAADAIASYWDLRKKLFGEDRYYERMTISNGTNATNDDCAMSDILEEFNKGYARITGFDNRGRAILFIDKILMSNFPRPVVCRILFYWVHQLIYNRSRMENCSDTDDAVMSFAASRATLSVSTASYFSYIVVVNVKVRITLFLFIAVCGVECITCFDRLGFGMFSTLFLPYCNDVALCNYCNTDWI